MNYSGKSRDNSTLAMNINGSLSMGTATPEPEVMEYDCTDPIPVAYDVFQEQPLFMDIIMAFITVLVVLIIAIFIEETVFFHRHCQARNRRACTLTVLAAFPVCAVTSHLAVFVPRSSTLMDLVVGAYMGNVLCKYPMLISDYLGDRDMCELLKDKPVKLRGPPCCCCLFCLPTVGFNHKVCRVLKWMVIQVAYCRPILMLIAAVLWTNGNYIPGDVSPSGSYLYINSLNVFSTLFAMYALQQLTAVCLPALAAFNIRAKLCIIQLVLISTAILGLITGMIVKTGAIPCVPPLSSKGRGQRLYNILLIIEMFPLALLGRKFFRRKAECTLTYLPDKTSPKIDPEVVPNVKVETNEPLLQEHVPVPVATPVNASPQDISGKSDEKERPLNDVIFSVPHEKDESIA